jgi:PII-like signaling protein
LLLAAKRQKLAGAATRQTDCGFVGGHPINAFSAEATAFDLPVCVELLGTREQLETFFETNADLLRGRVVVYQDVEQWQCREAVLTAAR